jgi:hypothetical protein
MQLRTKKEDEKKFNMGFGWSSPKLKGAGPFTSFIFGPSVEIQGGIKIKCRRDKRERN